MEHRPLGRTGMHVSRFGLGTMVLGAWGNTDMAACHRIINQAIDGGVNLVDTADVYGAGENETIVGAAIAGRRDDVVLCTKFHHPVGDHDDPNRRGNSRRWIMTAIDDSLRRLGVDHIDLYQVHRPDPDTAIDETVDALTDLVRAGKIRAWGTSTFPADEIVEAQWAASRRGAVGPHTEQPPYSILCRGIEREVLPAVRRHGMGTLVWSPLSGGWLTGKYRRDQAAPAGSRADTNPDHFDGSNEAKFTAVEALQQIADDAGLPLTHMALAFVVQHPGVTCALIGPRTEEQLADLLGAADVVLDDDVLDAIDTVVAPGTTINPADVGWVSPGLAAEQRRR
ncbi:aldo/keto reductase [Ilumatobacter coccineus]|uniref:Aldo-keto reductase n=1 Tax=Ilumatobacter coccineus (strain NBRC 103263 / KCTC 29153 / YM16-304) TaxID=1313172 RepID=A0A6C7EKR2_ILUCY|nr:aldo/keto reductase [Ilumatobacter coccineus]BAN04526.1 aldo-keto reductase [Ilumatobacter coccineus YM16-304]